MNANGEALKPYETRSLFGGSAKSNLLLSLVLIAATVALYYPVHRYGFINYDDPGYVTENPHIRTGLDLDVVRWAFTHSYDHNWHPLTWISHAVDIDLYALEPGGHHITNLLLHTLNVVLLFWVLQGATGFAGRSFMVAALFALHPVNVESVAWIAERKNVLSMLFFLLALGAYRWYVREPRGSRYLMVTLLYVLGLMAKSQVITLPCVLLLWDYWPLQRMFPPESTREGRGLTARSSTFSQLVMEKLPLFVIAAGSALITSRAQHVAPADRWPYTFAIRLGNAISSYASYIREAIWPSRLALMYLHPGYSLKIGQVLVALLLLLAITALVLVYKRHRYLPVGWFWFLGTLVPMIGIVQVSIQARADRYAYEAFIGLFIMVCWGLTEWAERRALPGVLLPAISVAVLLALGATAHRQLGYWSDSLTLWTHVAQVTENNWVAELNIGNALRDSGHPDQAISHFLRSAEINPDFAATNLDIGLYEQEHGNLTQAIEYYKRVQAMWQNPDERVLALRQMARAYRDLGDPVRAKECIEAAGRPAPPHP